MLKVKNTDKLTDPRMYIEQWVTSHANLNLLDPRFFDKIHLDYLEDFKELGNRKTKPIHKDHLLAAYREFMMEQPERDIKKIAEALTCEKEDLEPIRTWLNAFAKTDDLAVAVMAHWIWQVKRRAADLPVKWQIMPVFRGAQGLGKTFAIRRLIGNLSYFTMTMKASKMSDERQYSKFSKTLVAFLDEMEGADRADIDAMKNQITAETNDFRVFYTTDHAQVKMRCSFIGASNRPLNEIIYDSTGMRRFYEILAPFASNQEVINNLNYETLWRGVDEKLEDGYLHGEMLKELNKRQQSYASPEDVEFYIDNFGLVPNNEGHKEISQYMLYNHYRDSAVARGAANILSYQAFHRKLINRGISYFETRDDKRTRVRYYRVSKDCSLKEQLAVVKEKV